MDPFAATGLTFSPANCIDFANDACITECPHLLTALIEKYGVDVDSFVGQASSKTLMIAAALHGSTKCIAVLLSHGADVNLPVVCEDRSLSPLLAAVLNGHVAVCRQLVEAGADLEFRGQYEFTPLHLAAQHGHCGVTALLMQRGANTRATSSDLCTPIMVACFNQHLLCVQALLPHGDLAHRSKDGGSLLHIAAFHGGPAVLEAILPRYVEAGLVDIPMGPVSGADSEASDLVTAGSTPLMSACSYGHYTEAKILLKAGASRYAKASGGYSPLHYCLKGTSMACLQLLLGTAPHWHYTQGQLNDNTSELHVLAFALVLGSVDACKLLIAAGAVGHASTSDGDTARACADRVRSLWPEKPELAALFDPDALQEPFTPPCCANCLKGDIKLRACSTCHAAQYCSTACQRAHWRAHKPACISTKDVQKAVIAKCST
jgi:ankyrin repeat protein